MTAPTPKHHPHDDLIYSYAKGSSDTALNLILATHIHHCDQCRTMAQSAEHLFGEHFSALTPAPQDQDAPDAVFDSLWHNLQNDFVKTHDTPHSSFGTSPLERYMERNQRKITQNRTFPGITEEILPLSSKEIKVSVMTIDAGLEIPKHTHEGLEITQIISGGFYDSAGAYHAGDLTIKDQKDNHSPKIFDSAPCKCLVVRYGGLEFTGAMRFLYNPIFRLLD